jgi:hypothetical protein
VDPDVIISLTVDLSFVSPVTGSPVDAERDTVSPAAHINVTINPTVIIFILFLLMGLRLKVHPILTYTTPPGSREFNPASLPPRRAVSGGTIASVRQPVVEKPDISPGFMFGFDSNT